MVATEQQEDALPEDPVILETQPRLTTAEQWNITFLVLAFSCVVANMTLIVGTGAVTMLSVGGSTSLAPLTLAVFFLGMSLVSLTATHWIFAKWGRKVGFWTGCALGMVGVGIACLALVQSSPTLVLISQIFLGGSAGMGMYLRYSAAEVVPPSFASKAVTWVLAGGCLAAFVGPEASQATVGAFGDESDGDDHLKFLGTFIVAGGFFALQAIFVGMVGFPSPTSPKTGNDSEKRLSDDEETAEVADSLEESTREEVASLDLIIRQQNFLLPLLAAVLAWAIMAMPMAIFRVTMQELGFTSRQSLTVIEFHFIAMYMPGFWSGSFIQKYGTMRACQVALVCWITATVINLLTPDNDASTATWFLGLIFIGIGWNFGFSSATIWSTKAYDPASPLKPKLQAANECGMFFFAGAAIFSTGYLYEDAGGGGIDGWRLLNYVVLGFCGLYGLLLVYASRVTTSAPVASPPSAEVKPPVELGDVESIHSI